MKKDHLPKEPSTHETADPDSDDPQDRDQREGRSGEGAHSAMKHWLNEERHRLKRAEH